MLDANKLMIILSFDTRFFKISMEIFITWHVKELKMRPVPLTLLI